MRIRPIPATYEALYKCGAEDLEKVFETKRAWDYLTKRWHERRREAFADFVTWGDEPAQLAISQARERAIITKWAEVVRRLNPRA